MSFSPNWIWRGVELALLAVISPALPLMGSEALNTQAERRYLLTGRRDCHAVGADFNASIRFQTGFFQFEADIR
jgi:hypothetical protein